MTGNIIPNGVNEFTPIVDRLGSIANEIIPYMLYITIICAGVYLSYYAVKSIIGYLVNKNKSVFYYRDYDIKRGKITGYNKNGTPQYEVIISDKRIKRKKPKRQYFKRFR